MERWLTQRMSVAIGVGAGRSDGVCANVEFPSPRRLIGDAVAAASGIDPERDPWLPERAVWLLLEVVDGCLDEPWLATLAAHLGGAGPDGDGDDPAEAARRARRFTAIRHLADLYDRYAIHRPELVRSWAAGDDRGIPAGAGWQAELWRRLRARIDVPDPAERVRGACANLEADPALVDLPERFSLFGLTRLPAGHLEVLRAFAVHRDVHLFLLHPSPALWDRVAEHPAGGDRIVRRAQDTTARLPHNRLLASWGHDAREMQLVVSGGESVDHHHPVEQDTDSVLGRTQSDVRQDVAPPGAPLPEQQDQRPPLDPQDRSIQVHACHGRARQVEVLRDAILHELQEDPTLEPRDVIVMCPDIETFAPLIQATFGVGEGPVEPGKLQVPGGAPPAPAANARPRELRVRLADRSLRETNPVLGVVARLLELTTARATASEVLVLADREPVRRRFRFAQDDKSRLEEWVATAGARWGFDAPHRKAYNLQDVEQGTWAAGLDRLLTGVALTEDEPRLLASVVPLDDVDSSAIDLAGRFAEYVERLQALLDAFAEPMAIAAWTRAIADAADALTAAAPSDAWQRSELQRLLADVEEEATGEDGTVAPALLDAADVTALLEGRLAGRPTRANFRTGHLTVCTLQPMRSVPHRVVCLLGLDDTVFPRRSPRDGDDLLIATPRAQHVGDRDARSEDRQILLDALMAATDRLVITYTGNDERTNAERAPAVPVSELLDVVQRTTGDRDGVVVRHPLQPFDRRNFEPGALVPGGPWSFDATTLAGAVALARDRVPPPPFLHGPLPPAASPLLELDDVIAFLGHPVRAFLRQRLGVGAATRVEEIDDALPVELDFRAQWA